MDRNPACANVYMSISQAAEMMNNSQADVLPVIDEFGGFRLPETVGDVELENVLYATIPFVAVKPGQFRMAAAAAK